MESSVIVEFYGIPRLRAGQATLAVRPGTVADVLRAIARAFPGLADVIDVCGQLAPHYLLSRDGHVFLTDPAQPVDAGDRVLLMSADAGG